MRTAAEKKIQLTEHHLKRILKIMSEKDYVTITKGRGGIKLTNKGIEMYEKKDNKWMKIQFYPFINKEKTDLSENTGKNRSFYNIGNIVHRTNFRMFQRKHLAKRRPLRATCVHRNLRFHHAHFSLLGMQIAYYIDNQRTDMRIQYLIELEESMDKKNISSLIERRAQEFIDLAEKNLGKAGGGIRGSLCKLAADGVSCSQRL